MHLDLSNNDEAYLLSNSTSPDGEKRKTGVDDDDDDDDDENNPKNNNRQEDIQHQQQKEPEDKSSVIVLVSVINVDGATLSDKNIPPDSPTNSDKNAEDDDDDDDTMQKNDMNANTGHLSPTQHKGFLRRVSGALASSLPEIIFEEDGSAELSTDPSTTTPAAGTSRQSSLTSEGQVPTASASSSNSVKGDVKEKEAKDTSSTDETTPKDGGKDDKQSDRDHDGNDGDGGDDDNNKDDDEQPEDGGTGKGDDSPNKPPNPSDSNEPKEQESDGKKNVTEKEVEPDVLEDMKDELKAANDVIRYQREFIKELIEQKNSSHAMRMGTTSTNGSGGGGGIGGGVGDFNFSDGVQSLIRRLQLQVSKLKHDRALGEFQLRNRITDDAVSYGESIRRWKKEAKDWQIRFKTAAFDHSVETRKLKERIQALESALKASGEDVPPPPVPTTGLGRQVTWAVGDRDNTHFTTSTTKNHRQIGGSGSDGGHQGHGHHRRPRRNNSRANPPLLTRFATIALSPVTGLSGGTDTPVETAPSSSSPSSQRPEREFRRGRKQQQQQQSRPSRATSTPISSTTTAGTTTTQAPARSSSRIANLELFINDVEERDRKSATSRSSGLFAATATTTTPATAYDEFGGDPLSASWKSAVADATTEEMESDQSTQSKFLKDAMKRSNSFRFFV